MSGQGRLHKNFFLNSLHFYYDFQYLILILTSTVLNNAFIENFVRSTFIMLPLGNIVLKITIFCKRFVNFDVDF